MTFYRGDEIIVNDPVKHQFYAVVLKDFDTETSSKDIVKDANGERQVCDTRVCKFKYYKETR